MKNLFLTFSLILAVAFNASAQYATASDDAYEVGQRVSVYFAGLPGNAQDWITVVRADLPDDKYDEYFYLKGQKEGVLNFTKQLPAGNYEVRTYYNWPDGGYKVMIRYPFKIVAKKVAQPAEQVRNYGLCERGKGLSSLQVSLNNQSDWRVRFRLIDHGRSASEWKYINPKKSGSDTYSLSTYSNVDGVEIQWLDIAKWKNFNNMASIHKYGDSWSFTVTGAVFPPKPIKLD